MTRRLCTAGHHREELLADRGSDGGRATSRLQNAMIDREPEDEGERGIPEDAVAELTELQRCDTLLQHATVCQRGSLDKRLHLCDHDGRR